MTKDEAIKTIAADALHRLVEEIEVEELILWEDYPEIGENDWRAVQEAIRGLGPQVAAPSDYDAAYEFLTALTTKEN